MKIQKVVRTKSNKYNQPYRDLENYLNDGYLVIMANPFISNGTTVEIEYILEKLIPPPRVPRMSREEEMNNE